VKKIKDSRMKLFSWFIKTDKCSNFQKECLDKSVTKTVTKTVQSKLEKELSTINKNTMWPIAKVRTTR
jgi:hypothetical protein